MVIEMKKFFHSVKYVPCQWKIALDSTFSSVLSWLSYKCYIQIPITERTLLLSHSEAIEEKLIAFSFPKSKHFT